MAFTDRSLPAREATLAQLAPASPPTATTAPPVPAIAAEDGIDPSMVMRYFGSKRQLFAR
jgi:hypothetical protein